MPLKKEILVKLKLQYRHFRIEYELHVGDNGKGLPEGFDPAKSKTLGLKLVNILSRQLKGCMRSNSDRGASFIVKFKYVKTH